jgi:hypothetical protein
MPTASHHVACVTDDPDAVGVFLTEVVGLPVHLRFRVSGDDLTRTAGWPANDGADVTMYGRPPAGIVEVIAIPEALRGRVTPRLWLVSFATADVTSFVDRARARGLDPSEPVPTRGDVDITTSIVDVGGLTWEFVSFD